MPRDSKVFLQDILDAVASIRLYTTGLTLLSLSADRKTLDAVIRNLEIIGEAVKNLPKAAVSRHPEVPWKKIAGLRDILAHEYFGIDEEIIWDIVQNKLPGLETAVRKMLQEA